MALSVQVDDRRLPAAEIAVERAVGRPVRWRCLLRVSPDMDATRDVQDLARVLSRPAARLAAYHDNTTLVEQARVTGARWQAQGPRLLEVEAHTTAAAGEGDIFVPRRRVHRVSTWCELIDGLKHVAEASTGVRNHLARYPFESGGHTSIVQDGESDWEFLSNIVTQFARFERQAALARLAVVGGNDPSSGSARRWVLNWGCGAGYERFQDVAGRRVSGPEAGTHTSISFGTLRHAGAYAYDYPTAHAPAVIHHWKDRPFSIGEWESWVNRDAPFFLGDDDAFAWKAEDRLTDTGQPYVVTWTTDFTTAPKTLAIDGPLPQREAMTWIGTGTVTTSPDRDHWMEVVLAGFEPGDDRVEARVATPYSGPDNTKGLHFVPEQGTPVAVGWSGRLTDPMVVLGNVRDQQAAFPSPAVWLESTLTSQYVDIACKSIGAVSVGSNLDVAVDGTTEVKSDSTMALTADGCDVELRGGVFYTGSGL